MQDNEADRKGQNFEEGLIWNYASIIILALSGILFDTLIICFYNAEALGVFNQVYAYYIFFSQLCVWGVHMSVVRAIPLSNEKEEQKRILSSAILFVLGISCIVCFLIRMGMTAMSGSDLKTAFCHVLPALVCFAINKVVLGFFNGLSEMKTYAVLQSLRSISIAMGILFLALVRVHYTQVTWCFFIGEFTVAVINAGLLFKHKMISWRISADKIKEHFFFGNKILLSNMVLELNTKVDVICLGWILKDDHQIGIYSFAVLFAEGFYQLFVVIRRSINPMIAGCCQDAEKGEEAIRDLSAEIGRYIRVKKWLAGMLVLTGYGAVCLILNKREYLKSVFALAIICFFIALTAKSIVMGNLFAQIGKPEKESFINICTVFFNFVGNIVLIYYMGMNGAALATGVSYIVFALLLSYMAKKYGNVQIGF